MGVARILGSRLTALPDKCRSCYSRDTDVTRLTACGCKICAECLRPLFRLSPHAPLERLFAPFHCPGCRREMAGADLQALLGEEGDKQAQGYVFDMLEKHVVESGGRGTLWLGDNNVMTGVKMCKAVLMLENALHDPSLDTKVEESLRTLRWELHGIRTSSVLGGRLGEYSARAILFRGGMHKLLRAWLSRAYWILEGKMTLDGIDETVLLLISEIAESPALLPCLEQPTKTSYNAPVPDEYLRATSAMLQERRSVYIDLRQLRKLAWNLMESGSWHTASRSLQRFCDDVVHTAKAISRAVRESQDRRHHQEQLEQKAAPGAPAATPPAPQQPRPQSIVDLQAEEQSPALSSPCNERERAARLLFSDAHAQRASPPAAPLSERQQAAQYLYSDKGALPLQPEAWAPQTPPPLPPRASPSGGVSERYQAAQLLNADKDKHYTVSGPLPHPPSNTQAPTSSQSTGHHHNSSRPAAPDDVPDGYSSGSSTPTPLSSTGQQRTFPQRMDSLDRAAVEEDIIQSVIQMSIAEQPSEVEPTPSCAAKPPPAPKPSTASSIPIQVPSREVSTQLPGPIRSSSLDSAEEALLEVAKRESMMPAPKLPRADSFTKADLGNSYLREQALVGERLPLQKLIESCGRELARRLRELEPRFADWRSINGDGNCFYRSFLFLLLEGLLGDRRQARAVHRRLERVKDKMLATAHGEQEWEGGALMLEGMVQEISEGRVILFRLLINMNDREFADPMILFLRHMTSWEMLKHAERYENFILEEEEEDERRGGRRQTAAARDDDAGAEGEAEAGAATQRRRMQRHCRKFVNPMGQEAEEWHMNALSRALQVPINVESIGDRDRSFSIRIWHGDDSGSPESRLPAPNVPAWLLYVPGHYEIIYPR